MTLKETTDTAHHCLECDYNLTGLTSDRCPECGAKIDRNLLNFAYKPLERTGGEALLALLTAGAGIITLGFATILFVIVIETSSFKLTALWFAIPTVAAGCLHLLISVEHGPNRAIKHRTFSMLPRIIYAVAITQITVVLLGFLIANPGPKSPGLVGYLLTCIIFAFPGWSLLLAATITFSSRRERIRHLRKRYERRTDEHPGPPFRILAAGRFHPENVHTQWQNTPRPTDPATEARIESQWQSALADAKTNNGGVLILVEILDERLHE